MILMSPAQKRGDIRISAVITLHNMKTPELISTPPDSQFDLFWKEYPRKEAKSVALRAFRIALRKTTLSSMIEAVQKQRGGQQWQRGIIPHPATWLNQERWNDECQPLAQTAAITPIQAQIHHSEYLRVIERIKTLRSQYEAHQAWSSNDKTEISKLKIRQEQLKSLLGIQF